MRCIVSLSILTLFAGLVLTTPSRVSAQDDAVSEPSDPEGSYPADPAAESTSTVPAPPPTQLEEPTLQTERVDGPRFRGGVAATFGGEFFSEYDYSAMLFGVDGRFGVQVNDLIGVYFAPHLSAGGKRGAGATGITSTLAAIVMVDFTLLDSLFVGAGAGYMVFNNPNGPALAFRVGGYPVKGFADSGPKRRGLVISLDTRIGFMGGGNGNGVQVMGAIGYETF